jgi:pimeloyl-ACP methyl ester carboxylesterase
MAEIGQLTVRLDKPKYGQVAPAVTVLDGASPYGRRSIVLLIHGYANSQTTASGSFSACLSNLEKIASKANTSLLSPVFEFYWPGDVDIPVISEMSYPWEIKPAVASAGKLAEFLEGLAGPGGTPVEVHFISHSLGCRVVLETLKQFLSTTKSPVIVRSISLMAAAVPVHMAENTKQLLNAASLPTRRQVLFSSSDLVLMIAFRLGETLAFEGFFPEAVGSFGNPTKMSQQQHNLHGYKHWDYWPSASAATYLANFLQVPVAVPPPPNVITENPGPDSRNLPAAAVPDRALPVRSLP